MQPHKHLKLFEWGRLLVSFASMQFLVQLIGLVSGLMLVRLLDKAEYALFIIANTMLATTTLLSDVGISSGLSAVGGKVWQDRYRFSQLINTALHLRKTLLFFSILAVFPLSFWLLNSNGASPGYAFIITAILLIGIMPQVSNSILVMIPRLYLQVGRLQKLDLATALTRLGLILTFYLVWLNAATAIVAAIISIAAQYYFLRRWARQMIDTTAPLNEVDRKTLWTTVKKQAPNDIYFGIQSLIMIWLISFFGNANNVAEVGALGRLALVFAVINSTMTGVILPRFTRCQTAATLKRRYIQIVAVFVLLGVFLVLVAKIYPTELLYILGPQYLHLKSEVVLMVLSSAVGALGGVMWNCNYSKGWIPSPIFVIPVGILIQIFLLYVLDISTVSGILIFNILSGLSAILTNAGVFAIQIGRFQDS